MFDHFLDFDSNARRHLLAALDNFMRILGVLLLLAGLGRAMVIFGMVLDADTAFLALTIERRIVLVFLTVFYLTAAVGLWNKMSWGLVVWLTALTVDVLTQVFMPGTFGLSALSLLFHIITLAVYGTLIFLIRKTVPDTVP